ncbi:hypothetical protein BgiMline_006783 [Biomphalaria glabrata]|nr:hypothetical protein BgiMline_004653 [Biomphalaria glabrata]
MTTYQKGEKEEERERRGPRRLALHKSGARLARGGGRVPLLTTCKCLCRTCSVRHVMSKPFRRLVIGKQWLEFNGEQSEKQESCQLSSTIISSRGKKK